jgi:hypothetical protein
MKAIAFFPWWPLKETIEVPGYKIIPFVRGKEPYVDDSASQSLVDEIIAPYKSYVSASGDSRPINNAAVVQIDDDIFIGELADDLAQDLFILAEILCISSIANIRYFTQLNYCNRTIFQLVIQRIDQDNDWLVITSRRRDGKAQNLTGKKDASIPIPEQARTTIAGVQLDSPFAASLLKAKNQLDLDTWLEIYDAILYFNLANTDSSDMAIQSELILTVSSMERIVGSKGKINGLIRGVMNTIQTFCKLDELPEGRIDRQVRKRFKKAESAEEVWLRDIYNVRGNLAHGKKSHKYASVWSPWEHLLLGAHFVPLLVKSRLASQKLYSLTAEDEVKIRAFPRLLIEGLEPDDVDELDTEPQSKWDSIISSEGMRRAHREALKLFEGEAPISTNQ